MITIAPSHNTLTAFVVVVVVTISTSEHGFTSEYQLYYGPIASLSGCPNEHITHWTDMLDNSRAFTRLPGIGLESWSYSPFGTRTIRDPIGNEIPHSAYGVTLGFGSRPLVKRLNVLDFHHRLYNERDGSFLTRDPLHYIDTHNERQYAMHNPIDLTDYDGLMSQGGQTIAQGAGTGAPVISPTGNPTGDGEKPNGPDICVNGGASSAATLPWIMRDVQLHSPEEYERRLREKLDELIEQHGADIITAHESGALVPWARPPQYVIWLLNGYRPAFQATISTQSQADLAKALINAREPKPYEPGGWAFNAFGPNGAAYELVAVFGGFVAAPRVFRGATTSASTPLPTAIVPPSPVSATRATPIASTGDRPSRVPPHVPGGEHSISKPIILYHILDSPTLSRNQLLRDNGIWAPGRNLSFVQNTWGGAESGFILATSSRMAIIGLAHARISKGHPPPFVLRIHTHNIHNLQAYHPSSILEVIAPSAVGPSVVDHRFRNDTWVIPIHIPLVNIIEGGKVIGVQSTADFSKPFRYQTGSHIRLLDD